MEQKSEIIVYQPNDMLNLEVRVENDSIWLTQSQMSELFQRDRSVITKHINNVFKENIIFEPSKFGKKLPFSQSNALFLQDFIYLRIKLRT